MPCLWPDVLHDRWITVTVFTTKPFDKWWLESSSQNVLWKDKPLKNTVLDELDPLDLHLYPSTQMNVLRVPEATCQLWLCHFLAILLYPQGSGSPHPTLPESFLGLPDWEWCLPLSNDNNKNNSNNNWYAFNTYYASEKTTLLSRYHPYFVHGEMKLDENKKLTQDQTDNKWQNRYLNSEFYNLSSYPLGCTFLSLFWVVSYLKMWSVSYLSPVIMVSCTAANIMGSQ